MTTPERLLRNAMLERIVEIRMRQHERRVKEGFENLQRKYMGKDFLYAPDDVINDAVANKDVTFLDRINNACIGIQKLRGNWPYKFLKDIESGNVAAALEKLKMVQGLPLTDQHFFKFSDRDYRTYFVTPSHVARTHEAITTLGNLKADFNAPDSEGRLPLFFISRFAKDRWVFPTLCMQFNVNANDSGKLPNFVLQNMVDQIDDAYDPEIDKPLQPNLAKRCKQLQHTGETVQADLDHPMPPIYDPPIIRAIKYRNLQALRGLAMLPPQKIDLNIRFQWNHMTPLIYAVLKADEAVDTYNRWQDVVQKSTRWDEIIPLEVRAWDVTKAVWAVRFLASQPGVDPKIMDTTGSDAKGYARTDPVKKALNDGFSARSALSQLYTTYPSLRFTR